MVGNYPHQRRVARDRPYRMSSAYARSEAKAFAALIWFACFALVAAVAIGVLI
jgi:hypothetical protein